MSIASESLTLYLIKTVFQLFKIYIFLFFIVTLLYVIQNKKLYNTFYLKQLLGDMLRVHLFSYILAQSNVVEI